MIAVKRALLSCHDKTGLEVFGRALAGLGVELVASGGTAEFLTKHGLRVISVEQFAGISEQLDGRVKTLHPKIHAGILARRDDPAHVRSVGEAGLIDLVVVSLYPFQQTIARPGVALAEAVEQIDIGGVALLRAAAKNFGYVAAVSHPEQYAAVAEALRQGKGRLPKPLARGLAVTAFEATSAYDQAIFGYLSNDGRKPRPSSEDSRPPRLSQEAGRGGKLPESASLALRRRQPPRSGENPHQAGAWYDGGDAAWGLGTLRQLQGKELSYNNLLDLDAALRCLLEFSEPACAIIKHHSQCGLASAAGLPEAYARAYDCDPESAFGGIVGCNRPVDRALAERLAATFLEVVLAPSVEPSAAAVLSQKANLRVVTVAWPSGPSGGVQWRQLAGGWLGQQPDNAREEAAGWNAVTRRAPTDRERRNLAFAWKAAKHVISNGIVIASDCATVGIGQGQPSRVGSVRLAIQHAGPRAQGAVAASDGFFPFPDGVEQLPAAGVPAGIQPGGSIRDPEVIAAADKAKLAMLVTGVRHFRH